MRDIKEIIRACVNSKIPVRIVSCEDSADGMVYEVEGFAKSGVALVFVNHSGAIQVNLRYGTVEYIETFEDLALICKRWVMNYEDRGYSSGAWQGVFELFGWVKTTKITETKSEWV